LGWIILKEHVETSVRPEIEVTRLDGVGRTDLGLKKYAIEVGCLFATGSEKKKRTQRIGDKKIARKHRCPNKAIQGRTFSLGTRTNAGADLLSGMANQRRQPLRPSPGQCPKMTTKRLHPQEKVTRASLKGGERTEGRLSDSILRKPASCHPVRSGEKEGGVLLNHGEETIREFLERELCRPDDLRKSCLRRSAGLLKERTASALNY